MKPNAGLWLDHREAIVVVLNKAGEVTRNIPSNVEKHPRRSDESSGSSQNGGPIAADDSRQREMTGHLAHYYDEIISHLRDAGAILILGPGEAKGELRKRFEKHKGDTRMIEVKTADRMTEPQLVAQIRHHFHDEATRKTF